MLLPRSLTRVCLFSKAPGILPPSPSPTSLLFLIHLLLLVQVWLFGWHPVQIVSSPTPLPGILRFYLLPFLNSRKPSMPLLRHLVNVRYCSVLICFQALDLSCQSDDTLLQRQEEILTETAARAYCSDIFPSPPSTAPHRAVGAW